MSDVKARLLAFLESYPYGLEREHYDEFIAWVKAQPDGTQATATLTLADLETARGVVSAPFEVPQDRTETIVRFDPPVSIAQFDSSIRWPPPNLRPGRYVVIVRDDQGVKIIANMDERGVVSAPSVAQPDDAQRMILGEFNDLPVGATVVVRDLETAKEPRFILLPNRTKEG